MDRFLPSSSLTTRLGSYHAELPDPVEAWPLLCSAQLASVGPEAIEHKHERGERLYTANTERVAKGDSFKGPPEREGEGERARGRGSGSKLSS
jgi:hypothetical protein